MWYYKDLKYYTNADCRTTATFWSIVNNFSSGMAWRLSYTVRRSPVLGGTAQYAVYRAMQTTKLQPQPFELPSSTWLLKINQKVSNFERKASYGAV